MKSVLDKLLNQDIAEAENIVFGSSEPIEKKHKLQPFINNIASVKVGGKPKKTQKRHKKTKAPLPKKKTGVKQIKITVKSSKKNASQQPKQPRK